LSSDLFMVAFGYHGGSFHGSQIQNDVRTVQGELIHALRRLKWWSEGCLEISSRTDAGVNVRMNLATIKLPDGMGSNVEASMLTKALNDHTSVELAVWGGCHVPEGTSPRLAISRTYLYRTEVMQFWPPEVDVDLFTEACSIIVGEHNFTNLCRLDSDRNPVRTIDSCIPWLNSNGEVVGFSVTAQSFLWNQVRRIASSFEGVVVGRITIDDLRRALDEPNKKVDFGRAPSDGLILWSISHPNFPMKDSGLPSADVLIRPPEGSRQRIRWRSLAKFEASYLLEREWLKLLN